MHKVVCLLVLMLLLIIPKVSAICSGISQQASDTRGNSDMAGLLDTIQSEALGVWVWNRYGGLLGMSPTQDDIYTRKATGQAITETAIDKAMELVGDTNPAVKSLLRHTAQKESKFGNDPDTFNFRRIQGGTVGHGGIMQITDRAFKNIVNSKKKDIQNIIRTLKDNNIDFKGALDDGKVREFLESPINSVLAARLHYRMNNRPLPSLGGVSKYYKDIYAPQTK
jgi:hypothetical protein